MKREETGMSTEPDFHMNGTTRSVDKIESSIQPETLHAYKVSMDPHFIVIEENELNENDDDLQDSSRSNKDSGFDTIIGHIEDVLMDENFQELQTTFLEKYWREFEDTDENKHIYMDLFHEYNTSIEKFIEDYLTQQIPDFKMEELAEQLEIRKNELDGEVFEILFTFTDFVAFKEMFMDYRAMKEGTVADLSSTLSVSSGFFQSQNGFQI